MRFSDKQTKASWPPDPGCTQAKQLGELCKIRTAWHFLANRRKLTALSVWERHTIIIWKVPQFYQCLCDPGTQAEKLGELCKIRTAWHFLTNKHKLTALCVWVKGKNYVKSVPILSMPLWPRQLQYEHGTAQQNKDRIGLSDKKTENYKYSSMEPNLVKMNFIRSCPRHGHVDQLDRLGLDWQRLASLAPHTTSPKVINLADFT